MKDFYTIFDPSFIDYDKNSILELCNYYTKNNLWDDIYPGVKLNSKRYSEDFLKTDARKIIESFSDDLNITHNNAQIFQMLPGQRGVLHKDTDRHCGILFPMTPIGDNFSPIMFYNESKEKIDEVNYSEQAIIINVLKYHNVAPTNEIRINFQIDFHIPYHQLIELYNSNRLFKY